MGGGGGRAATRKNPGYATAIDLYTLDAEHRSSINDCIATPRCPTPEILIASPVISRTTSEPSGGRARMMAAIVAGCCSVRTFRDCHNSIAFKIGILH